jgi:hypothetical protein
MKKLISFSILLFCSVLISQQNIGQVKPQATTQKKAQVKPKVTPKVTPQKKVQVKTQVTPQNKDQVKSQVTPCTWQKNEVDPFTGVSARTTNWEIAGYNTSIINTTNSGVTGDYKFSISENIQKKDTTCMLWIKTSTAQSVCFNKESKIMIKSGETILTINLLGGVICGGNITSYGNLDTKTRKFLRKHPIDLLRIQFSGDGNSVINVDLKNVDKYTKLESDYFIRTLRCFE